MVLMDLDTVTRDILQWIQDFVEAPNQALEGWPPCPFARTARLKNLIDIRLGTADPYIDMRSIIDMGGFDVIAQVYDPLEFSADEFNDLVDSANLAFLQGRGLIALADHPKDLEEVNGVCMNQGKYAIVFVQDLNKLNAFARNLAEKGFYKSWPEAYLQTLFRGREDPRT